MKQLIILVGVFIFLAGLALVLNSGGILQFISENTDEVVVYYLAIGVRLFLGVLFVLTARLSNFPLVMKIFGYLFIAVALVFILMGHGNFVKTLDNVMEIFTPYATVSGIAAVIFGGFVIYAYMKSGN
jgi:hypothetical protein